MQTITEQKINEFRTRINSINNSIAEKRAKKQLVKKQLSKCINELRELGINGSKEAKLEIERLDRKMITLYKDIDKDIRKASDELDRFD